MSLNRFYVADIHPGFIELDGPEARHMISVLRAKIGDKLEVFNGKGKLAICTVKTVSRKKIQLEVGDISTAAPRDNTTIVLAVSISKGQRFDWLIEKSTELGVDSIVPIIFHRTVKQPANPAVLQRWNKIAVAAAKQCKRFFIPKIQLPLNLDDFLSLVKKEYSAAKLLLALPGAVVSVSDVDLDDRTTIVFIGPEGGFTDVEIEQLINAGVHQIKLTDTVLRTETAAMTFAAVLCCRRNFRDSQTSDD
jgi:16S rRNA (uracil1498-N3)-methyltransferase